MPPSSVCLRQTEPNLNKLLFVANALAFLCCIFNQCAYDNLKTGLMFLAKQVRQNDVLGMKRIFLNKWSSISLFYLFDWLFWHFFPGWEKPISLAAHPKQKLDGAEIQPKAKVCSELIITFSEEEIGFSPIFFHLCRLSIRGASFLGFDFVLKW